MCNDKDKIKVTFCGKSSSEVTQSCYKVTTQDTTMLLDYGLYQNNNLITNYKVNSSRIKEIRPRAIDFMFISHANIDHCGAIPSLFNKGCNATVFVPKGNIELMRLMFKDSAKIMLSDAEKLTRKYNMSATPLYYAEDIDDCLSHFVECEFDKEITVKETSEETIKVVFKSAHHIINSAQILLTIYRGNRVKRILYTGDIGSPFIDKSYVRPFAKTESHVDIVIGECTYAGDKRNHSNKDRLKDIEKIKSVISQTCYDNKGKVLFPVFSLDRLQTILTTLYTLYHDDKEFNIPIVIDTPLGINICNLWNDIVDYDKDLWSKVFNWGDIKLSVSWEDSMSYQSSNEPMIILASSGMCTNGRSVSWIKRILPSCKNFICFCGYAAEGTLARKIKDYKSSSYIEVEGQRVKNACSITQLFSFSSHASREELLELYSDMNFEKLYLVHSDGDQKYLFAEELKERLSKKDKTSRVIVPYKSYEVTL